jgi:hypothetical protein
LQRERQKERLAKQLYIGRFMAVCFLISWNTVCIMMGSVVADFANSWPDWAPGPSPFLILWVPYAFVGIGILALFASVVSWIKHPIRLEKLQGHSTITVLPDDTEYTGFQTSGYREPTV